MSKSVAVHNLYKEAGVYFVAPIIAQLVDDNNHSQVALIIARIYGSAEDVSSMCAVYNLQLKRGYIDSESSSLRNSLVKRLVSEIKCSEERHMIEDVL